jgi:hypothetical protein
LNQLKAFYARKKTKGRVKQKMVVRKFEDYLLKKKSKK